MRENLTLWGLTPGCPRSDIFLPGSPERCLNRAAVEDNTGRVWMIEQLRPGQFERRERIGRALFLLAQQGLPIPAYMPDSNGQFAVLHEESHWQLSPFVSGEPLPQPTFIEDAERGENLGLFISALHRKSDSIHDFDHEPSFILEEYITDLMAKMAPRRPQEHDALLPVLASLTLLFEQWSTLPTTLCQGDFHPLNVIWQQHRVGAVIDWEFMGRRPALFDVANCLGCVGIEEPHALVRGLAATLLRTLRDKACLDAANFRLLPEMILGIRFAWISEWLRKKDEEMVQIEIRYMRLLANSIDTLLPAWKNILG